MYDNLWGAEPIVFADHSVETERIDMKETAQVTRLGKLDAKLRLQRKRSYARKPE